MSDLRDLAEQTLANSRRWFPLNGDEREQIIHQALGIAGECGEVIEPIKKWHRGTLLEHEMRERVAPELADVLTYLLNLSALLGIDLGDELAKKQTECERRWG